MRKIILGLILSFSFCNVAISETIWLNGKKINGLQALPNGGFIIYGNEGDDPKCAENGKLFYVGPNKHDVTEEGVNSLLSIALAAYSMGKEVSFFYDNSSHYCYVRTIYMK